MQNLIKRFASVQGGAVNSAAMSHKISH